MRGKWEDGKAGEGGDGLRVEAMMGRTAGGASKALTLTHKHQIGNVERVARSAIYEGYTRGGTG